MISKKMLISSLIIARFVMLAGIQGNAAATSLPSKISDGMTINGFKLSWNNNITLTIRVDKVGHFAQAGR